MTDDSKHPRNDRDEEDLEKEGAAPGDEPDANKVSSAKAAVEEEDEDDDDDEDDDEEEARAAAARSSAGKSKRPSAQKTSAKSKKPSGSKPHGAPKKSAASTKSSNVGLFVAGALIVGAAAGWFANEARGKAPNAEVQAAMAGGEGPCQAWSKKVCEGTGESSAACKQAGGVADLLSEEACNAALADVPATLEKVKAARADCDKLVSKLCKDLGPETGTCKMVTERTQSFPPDRCKEMLGSYDKVLGQLEGMEKRGGPGGPHGRPGVDPHGGPQSPGAGPGGPSAATPQAGGQIRLGGATKPKPAGTAAEPTAASKQ